MPRPARHPSSDLYVMMHSEAAAIGERNDCAVKAVAAVTGRPYAEVHPLFLEYGRKPGRGTLNNTTRAVLACLGFRTERRSALSFIERYPKAHQILKSVTSHHPDRFPEVWRDGRAYIFFTDNHLLAVVNGVNHDWSRGRMLRVQWIEEVIKIEG